jgi:hypothetical protein
MPAAADERQIIALLTRYATGIDRRDWALFQACFTDDARSDYGTFGQWGSAAQITAFMREAHAGMGPTLHRLSNFVIAAQGNRATARKVLRFETAVAAPYELGWGKALQQVLAEQTH